MWFMLGFLFGIVFCVVAVFLLAWYVSERDKNGQVERWINRFENKMEAKFDKKVKPTEGSVGRFVIRNGEIVRADD